MKVEFLMNGEDDYITNEITTIDEFKNELVYYIESTLQWEYGNVRDFYEWMEQCKFGRYAGVFTTRGSSISVMYHVELETVKTFLKNWNKSFGDMQMVEYNIIY